MALTFSLNKHLNLFLFKYAFCHKCYILSLLQFSLVVRLNRLHFTNILGSATLHTATGLQHPTANLGTKKINHKIPYHSLISDLRPPVRVTWPGKCRGQGQSNKPHLSVSSSHPSCFSHAHTGFLNKGMLRLSPFRNIQVCKSRERGKYSWQPALSDKGKCN